MTLHDASTSELSPIVLCEIGGGARETLSDRKALLPLAFALMANMPYLRRSLLRVEDRWRGGVNVAKTLRLRQIPMFLCFAPFRSIYKSINEMSRKIDERFSKMDERIAKIEELLYV